jgi:hypothetical protein
MSPDRAGWATAFGAWFAGEFGGSFLRDGLSRELVHRRCDSALAQQLFGWDDLNDVLERGSVDPAQLVVVKGGRAIDAAAFTSGGTIDVTRLTALLRDGHSLKIDALDRVHPGVRAATDDVRRLLGETTCCNLIVTNAHDSAFVSHFDEVEVFVVQCQGRKAWKVHGEGEPYPMDVYGDSDPARCPPAVIFDDVLVPGDVLYVPRGWWHTVQGVGDLALHLSFCAARRTGYDWLQWVLRRSLSAVPVRASLDRFAGPDDQAAQISAIVQQFLATAEGLTMEDFFTAERERTGPRPSASFPWAVTDGYPPESSHVSLVTLGEPERVESPGGGVELRIGGQAYRVPPELTGVLAVLLERRRLTIAELASASGAPVPACRAFARNFARLGLLSIR